MSDLADAGERTKLDCVNRFPVEPLPGAAPRIPLLPRVEAAARRAFDANETAEYNLMAWMHSHLQGLAKLAEGAPELGLSDGGRAIVAEIKGLL